MNARVRELVMLALLACLGLGLALANEDILFAGIFAAEAAFSAAEALYLSW